MSKRVSAMKPLRSLVAFGAVCVIIAGFSCAPEPGTSTPPVTIIELDPPGPKDPELAARAAVVIGSCLGEGNGAYNPQLALSDFYYSTRPAWPAFEELERTTRCLAEKADGCAGLDRCFATTSYRSTAEDPCESTCLPGNIATVCMDEVVEVRTECSRLGMECQTGGCAPYPMREPCDPSTADLCKDGIPRHCPAESTYQWRGVDCADHGLVCGVIQVVDKPWSLCQGTGAACDSSFTFFDNVNLWPLTTCEGTTARMCMNDREHVFDCGTIGVDFTCQDMISASVQCGLASECTVSADQATCEGDDIVLCNAGRIDRLSCTDLGFKGCDPDVGFCFPSPASKR